MDDEPVSWKYYVATGITAMIACFMSAVQGDAGIFSRVREILITLFKTDVHPLWVFVPAFILGVCACWVERPKNSRSVLIAGLASFSLFGFAPYETGSIALEGRNISGESDVNLVVQLQGLAGEGVGILIRDANFQIVTRSPLAADTVGFKLPEPGRYWVEVDGKQVYRDKLYPIDLEEKMLELTIELEKLEGWQGFWQEFSRAVRVDRPRA